MPSFYIPIESTSSTILTNVGHQVISGILRELHLWETFENAIYVADSFSAYSQFSDGNGAPSLNKNRCDVDIKYLLDKSQVPWPNDTPQNTMSLGTKSSLKGLYTPILVDEEAGVVIEHQTVACGFQMDFKLNFQTFDESFAAFDALMNRFKGAGSFTIFDIDFSYYVPMPLLEYLTAVKTRKTSYMNKTLLEYIADKKATEISFNTRASQLGMDEADRSLVVRCQQMSSVCQVTFDQVEPESRRVEALPDSFMLDFSVSFQFGRPTIIAVHSPITVDNDPLPYILFESCLVQNHYSTAISGVSQTMMVDEYLRRSYGLYNNSTNVIRIPEFDDWEALGPRHKSFEYRPLLIAVFTLDDGGITEIDLKQLGDIVLHPVTQNILKETGDDVLDYGSIFHVGVFAGDLPLDKSLLTVDDDLILRVSSNRPDKEYRLVLSETTNITKTDPKWNWLLLKHRYFFPLTVERNLEYLLTKKVFTIEYDNVIVNLISRLGITYKLKPILDHMVQKGEVGFSIYSYTQNATQLMDFLTYQKSLILNYSLPIEADLPSGIDPSVLDIIEEFYSIKASIESRSLLVVFLEKCLMYGYISLNDISKGYLRPNVNKYPYITSSGGFYAYNTPLRVLNFNVKL